MAKVTPHFIVGEVVQWDHARTPVTLEVKMSIVELADELETIREAWDSPLLISSWYRPPSINAMVGGAKNSQHILGRAVDIRPANGKVRELEMWLDKVLWKERALGYAAESRGYVHIDLRHGRIRWRYD